MDLAFTRLTQISYPVADVERAVAFFQGKLGLAAPFRPHQHMAFFQLGETSLFMEKSDAPEHASILYIACDDVAAATAELERRGVEVISQPHRITEQLAYDLWMSFFKDPDGHVLALSMEAPKGWKPS